MPYKKYVLLRHITSLVDKLAFRKNCFSGNTEPSYNHTQNQISKEKTMSELDPVSQYLHEIGKMKLLTAQEERDLSKILETGKNAQETLARYENEEIFLSETQIAEFEKQISAGKKAREKFMAANLRLVVSIAKKYPVPSTMEMLDLIQEGNLGLNHAIDMFDWRKGFKFSTYATFWIRQTIGRAIDQKGNIIALPQDKSLRLRRNLRETGMDGTGLNKEDKNLNVLRNPASLDMVVGEDIELGDLCADEDSVTDDTVLNATTASMLFSAMHEVLDEEDISIIELRFGLLDGVRHSYRAIGDIKNISGERVRRVVVRSLKTLRAEIPELLPEDYIRDAETA